MVFQVISGVFSIRRVSGLDRPLPGRLAIGGNKINVCEGMSHVLGQLSHWRFLLGGTFAH